MRNIITIIALAIAAILITDCTPPTEVQALERAEKLIETAPDTSLAILASIDGSALTGDALRARHALLLTYAHYRNYIVDTDDSLINIAVEHYSKSGDKRHLMQALYCRGTVLWYAQKHIAALESARHAFEIATELNDHYWIGKCAERLHSLYYDNYNRLEALKYADIARTEYHLAGKERHSIFSAFDLAATYSELGQFDNQRKVLDSLALIGKDDPILKRIILKFYAANFQSTGKYKEASITLDSLITEYGYHFFDTNDYGVYFRIALHNNDIEAANNYLDSAKTKSCTLSDTLTYLCFGIDLAHAKADYKQEVKLFRQLQNLQNKRIKQVNNESIELADRDYFVVIALEKQKRILRLRLLVAIAIMLITSIILLYMRRLKRRKKQIASYAAEIYDLSELIHRERTIRQQAEHRLEQAEKNLNRTAGDEKTTSLYFDLLNELCSKYYDNDGSEFGRRKLLNDIEKEIEQLKTQEQIAHICNSINDSFDGILDKLKQEAYWLRESDIVFMAFLFAGFSPRAISVFLDIKPNTVYTKKNRIKERIIKENLPNTELFMKYIK